jgi:predicted RNA-binding protein with PUA-like domain
MAYFLAKTDPESYSIDDLKRDGTTEWDGVRNAAAVSFIKTMKLGDTVNAAPARRRYPGVI